MPDNTVINTGTGGDVIGSDDIGGVKYQRVKLIYGVDGVNSGDVSSVNPFPVSNTFLSNQTGVWGYSSGVSGTVILTGGKKIISIAAHATTVGSVTINGGSSIPIPIGTGVSFEPKGNVVDPTIVFTSTDSYVIEYVT